MTITCHEGQKFRSGGGEKNVAGASKYSSKLLTLLKICIFADNLYIKHPLSESQIKIIISVYMPYSWLKRILFIIAPIAFYALSLYCIDSLVTREVVDSFGGWKRFFVIINFLILFIYWTILGIVLDNNRLELSDLQFGFFASIALCILPSMDFLPKWVFECYVLIIPATAIYMCLLTFMGNHIPFADKIWQLDNQENVWIFDKTHKLILNSTDNSTTFFTWEYNGLTNTIVIYNENEKRCYSIHTITHDRLTLMRIPSLETLTFFRRESGSPVIVNQIKNNVE